jgi:hypothetical protein
MRLPRRACPPQALPRPFTRIPPPRRSGAATTAARATCGVTLGTGPVTRTFGPARPWISGGGSSPTSSTTTSCTARARARRRPITTQTHRNRHGSTGVDVPDAQPRRPVSLRVVRHTPGGSTRRQTIGGPPAGRPRVHLGPKLAAMVPVSDRPQRNRWQRGAPDDHRRVTSGRVRAWPFEPDPAPR